MLSERIWNNKTFFYIYVPGALQITESDVSDQGKYECVANNSVGTEYSKSTTLYVKGMLFQNIYTHKSQRNIDYSISIDNNNINR